MQSLLFFLLALAILITVHEFGHFWVARRCGVKVLKFSIGFGKPIWKKQGQDGTEYILATIPLGGYVKMLDEREGEVAVEEQHRAFNRKPLSSRVAIVAAGPLANLLFAVFAYWLVFVGGISGIKAVIDDVVPESPAAYAQLLPGEQILRVNDNETPTWASVANALSQIADKGGIAEITVGPIDNVVVKLMDVPQQSLLSDQARHSLDLVGLKPTFYPLQPVIGKIVPDQAADKAGIQVGDKLLTVNGKLITDWFGWVDVVQKNADQLLTVTLLRQGEELTVTLLPVALEDGKGKIGAAVDPNATTVPDSAKAELQYGLMGAMTKAVATTWQMSVLTVKSIGAMIVGDMSTKNIGGPIAIAQFAGASADKGLSAFLTFLALISISLGILNLLPIPVLDGGHLFMYLIEWIKGEPLSQAMQLQGQKIGIIVLFSLMFFAFFNDLSRLFGF